MFHLKVGGQVLAFKIRSTSEGEITHMISQIGSFHFLSVHPIRKRKSEG